MTISICHSTVFVHTKSVRHLHQHHSHQYRTKSIPTTDNNGGPRTYGQAFQLHYEAKFGEQPTKTIFSLGKDNKSTYWQPPEGILFLARTRPNQRGFRRPSESKCSFAQIAVHGTSFVHMVMYILGTIIRGSSLKRWFHSHCWNLQLRFIKNRLGFHCNNAYAYPWWYKDTWTTDFVSTCCSRARIVHLFVIKQCLL